MSELFLGIIAAAVVVMAVIQVAVVVMAARAAQRIGALTAKLEADLRPLIANLQSVTSEAARAASLAAAQVERADKLFDDMTTRIDETLSTVQSALAGVTRGGAWLAGLKTVMGIINDLKRPSRRPSNVDEEDALFIG